MWRIKKAYDIKSLLNRLSIRSRLSLLVTGLMASVISLAAFLLFQQHQIAQKASHIAVQAHHAAMEASQMRESFSEMERYAAIDRINPQAIEKFRRTILALNDSLNGVGSSAERTARVEKLTDLKIKFEDYVASLNNTSASNQALIKANSEELSRAINSLIVLTEDAVFHKAEQIQADQQKAAELTFLFLTTFIFIGLIAAIQVISVIVRPLSSLADFVDQIRVEDDITSGSSLPIQKTEIPEIASLKTSFEHLLQRLRSYHSLNVKRLLIEKRQSDIISASTSEGILLLRDDEILYLNPVAERILEIGKETISASIEHPRSGGLRGRSVSLRGLIERDRKADLEHRTPGTPRKASGPRAVLNAILRTMPVELTLVQDERKQSYLLTAKPISYDLVEKIEHSVVSTVDQVLERFQANTIVIARDVTIMREIQEAKSHFLGTLSHEVKTPVTSLTMATRLLKKGIDQIPNPMHRSLITTCADDVDRLRKLLEELLTASRFDTLAQRLEIQEVDVVKLVRHAVQSFQVQAHERGIGLQFKTLVGPTSIAIPMDATKITWAISNLLTNALRHTPRSGEVEVFVAHGATAATDGRSTAPNESEVEVRIRDTGPGIDRVRQQRIFDKFNPFYDLRVARTGGAGIGLAIAREIVVAHGGRIWVASDPGHGAEFCFTLPAKNAGTFTYNQLKTNTDVTTKGAAGGATASS
jgi:signal transduction histidine kinase